MPTRPIRCAGASHGPVGAPPTYIDTGSLDIFAKEIIDYARRSPSNGDDVRLHLHPGCPHGFDRIPGLSTTVRAFADPRRVLRSF